MPTGVIEHTFTINVHECGQVGCGMFFAFTEKQEQEYRRTHETFYCPAGHPRVYRQETAEEKARRERDAARADVTHLRDQLAATQRDLTSTKSQLTKAKNRAAKGVCPVPGCKRSFVNVARHVQTQHPDFHAHP